MPTIETERLILRDFVPSDWDALNAFLSDPSVTRYMHFSSWDEQKRRQWLASIVTLTSNPQREAYNLAITLRSNGLLIGWLIHHHSDRKNALILAGLKTRSFQRSQCYDFSLRNGHFIRGRFVLSDLLYIGGRKGYT